MIVCGLATRQRLLSLLSRLLSMAVSHPSMAAESGVIHCTPAKLRRVADKQRASLQARDPAPGEVSLFVSHPQLTHLAAIRAAPVPSEERLAGPQTADHTFRVLSVASARNSSGPMVDSRTHPTYQSSPDRPHADLVLPGAITPQGSPDRSRDTEYPS